MDSKLTLNFDQADIGKAKDFAADNNNSLSRSTEFLCHTITTGNYANLEESPMSDWVNQIAKNGANYKTRSRKASAAEFYTSKKDEILLGH